MIDRRSVLGVAVAAASTPVRAQITPHHLKVGDRLDRFDRLTAGVKVYLRSQQRENQHVPTDIWRRETRFETLDGVSRLRIVQRWDGQAASLSERDSVFEIGTFRPLTHVRITTRDGERSIEGFRFTETGIVGLADLPGNEHLGFSVASDEAMYNFETDMEMLQTLPLAAGYSVSIPFYHPAPSTRPARYLWAVTGDERLVGPDGRPIDCWIVQTDYNAPQNPPARFWFAKANQQLIRQESAGPTGTLHRKTLLTV